MKLWMYDEYAKWAISNGIRIVYPHDPKWQERLYRNRMKYLERQLRWPLMPFPVWLDMYHYLWMTGKTVRYDCCGKGGSVICDR